MSHVHGSQRLISFVLSLSQPGRSGPWPHFSRSGKGMKKHNSSPFLRPTGGQRRAAAETGFAKAGVQFTNLRINELKRIS